MREKLTTTRLPRAAQFTVNAARRARPREPWEDDRHEALEMLRRERAARALLLLVLTRRPSSPFVMSRRFNLHAID